MTSVTESRPSVSPNVIAGLLLAAKPTLSQLGLPHPGAAEILEATGAGRTRAYEYKTAIWGQLEQLARPVGRPSGAAPAPSDTGPLSRQVLRYVMDHPGCVSHRGAERQRYSDDLRDFLLGLWIKEQATLDIATFARAVQVPLGTFKDWLRGTQPQSAEAIVEAPKTTTEGDHDIENEPTVTSSHLETICAEWKSWQGDFLPFCDHLQKHLRLPYGRTLNHKPRPGRQGQSRVEQYQAAAPTPEQVDQAKVALHDRLQKQQQALKTNKARTDPVTRQVLEEAFVRLDLVDPTGNLGAAIARYPIDAILAGVATFEGKRNAKTLPDGVDARYLLGIVKNLALQQEGFLISEALLQARLQAQDLMLCGLQRDRDTLAQTPLEPRERLKALLQRALDTNRRIDRLFWLQAAAEHLQAQPDEQRAGLWRAAYRRIHSTFRIPYADRAAAVHCLATKVLPLD